MSTILSLVSANLLAVLFSIVFTLRGYQYDGGNDQLTWFINRQGKPLGVHMSWTVLWSEIVDPIH